MKYKQIMKILFAGMVMLALAGMTSCMNNRQGNNDTQIDINTDPVVTETSSSENDGVSSTSQGITELTDNCNTIADSWLDNFDNSSDSRFIKDDAKQALNTLVKSVLTKTLERDPSEEPDFGEDINVYLKAKGTGSHTTFDEVSELTTKLSGYISDYIKQHPNLPQTKTEEGTATMGTEDKSTSLKRQDLDEIKQSISSLVTQQSTLIKELKDQGNNGSLIILIIALVLLTLIVSLILLVKFAQNTNRNETTTNLGEIKQQLEKIQHSLSTPRQSTGQSSSTQPTATRLLTDIISKLDNIMSRIHKLEQKKDSMPPIPDQKLTSTGKNSYFGPANSEGKFENESSHHRSGYSIYECTITDDKAVFAPCNNMDAIRSYDHMIYAVEFTGAARDKAKHMTIVDKGKAERRGSSWYVTTKAKVMLD